MSQSESLYDGPDETVVVRAGGIDLKVARPADPDRLLEAPDVLEWNRRDDYMPYWAYLWPGAYLLSDAVADEPEPAGQVLEIGCGLGLAGLVGLARGWTVKFTDYDSAPFRYIEASVAANGFDVAKSGVGLIDWRQPPPETYALILGADLLYERKLIPLVAHVLDRMLAPGGVALLTDPGRSPSEGFESEAKKKGLTVTIHPRESQTQQFGRVRGKVFRVARA